MSFILDTAKMWNGLPSAAVESFDLQNFKSGANSFLYLLLSTDSHFHSTDLSPIPFPLFC